MKRNSFEEREVPYQTLAKFGLTHEMIEDLPIHALDDISNGRPSPVLPVSMEVNEGYTIKSRTRFALVRMADGNVELKSPSPCFFAMLSNRSNVESGSISSGKHFCYTNKHICFIDCKH